MYCTALETCFMDSFNFNCYSFQTSFKPFYIHCVEQKHITSHMHKQRFIFANSFVAGFIDSNIAQASIVRGRLQIITTLTTFSNLPNFILNYWIVSSCSLSSIIWAFQVSASFPLCIVELYLFILKVFQRMQQFSRATTSGI